MTKCFADLIGDTHITPHEVYPDLVAWASEETTLLQVAANVQADLPDFIVHRGDMLDFHGYGFNLPAPESAVTRLGYLNYRRLLNATVANAAHFLVIGNWDGENGSYTEEEIERSLSQRLIYAPGPDPETYPEGGSGNQDYYAFTWSDALFIILNVMTYTPSDHLLEMYPGLVDDWTLGEEQLDWFRETLENATSKWRFVCIHHTVGGAAPDLPNSAYGRGGGQAAYVGEQAVVHQLMIDHGVQIFFYGHDHVFTDIVVDGIHYTLPGATIDYWIFDSTETGYTDYIGAPGHGRVTVSSDEVIVEFVDIEGEIIGGYTID